MSDPDAARHAALAAVRDTKTAADTLIGEHFDNLWREFRTAA